MAGAAPNFVAKIIELGGILALDDLLLVGMQEADKSPVTLSNLLGSGILGYAKVVVVAQLRRTGLCETSLS